MTDGAALPDQMHGLLDATSRSSANGRDASISASVSHDITDVEATWRALGAPGIDSAGQDFAFIRLWIEAMNIPAADQFFIVGQVGGVPVALLPLHRRSVKGVRHLAWFPGTHVGCNAPIVDRARLAALNSTERASLWRAMLGAASGAHLVYLKSVPQTLVDGVDIFAELGSSLQVETLYRAQFESWEQANTTQRSKSRRKHDRQQGEKLDALGVVEFEEIRGGDAALPLLDVMFRQRAARFVEMGVDDPFVEPGIRQFYDATVAQGSEMDVRLHVLRLNGDIVAVRYNVVHGDKYFCMISSMSDDPAIQGGSPGKQCLLRVMQTVFDQGARTFDMGSGFTDEKRHWCNVQVPVRQHYVPLSLIGTAVVSLHRGWQLGRKRIKDNKTLMGVVKSSRAKLLRLRGGRAEGKLADAED